MKIFKKIFGSKPSKQQKPLVETSRQKLEQKVVSGAKRAVKEYSRVFERLAEYDQV